VCDIAHNLSVASSTISRIVDRFDRTGAVARGHHNHILHEHNEFLVVGWILESPGIYLHELQQLLISTTGTEASVTTTFRTLKTLGLQERKYVLHYREVRLCAVSI